LDRVKLAVQSGFEKLQHGLETAVLRGGSVERARVGRSEEPRRAD
jgi:hypothetical protein